MKISGKNISLGEYLEEVYIPAGADGADGILFILGPTSNYDDFDKLVAEPKPPMKMIPGQDPEPDYSNKTYKQKLEAYAKKRTEYFMLKAMSYTKDLVWETVDLQNPETWSNFETELKSAGLTVADINRIFQAVIRVNRLDADHIKAARDRFLTMKAEAEIPAQ